MIVSKYNLPTKCFTDILNTIEHHMHLFSHNHHTDHSVHSLNNNFIDLFSNNTHKSNPFALASDNKNMKKLKLTVNLGIQDLAAFKKLRIDIFYDPEYDTPHSIAEEIINNFSLEASEMHQIVKLINEKIHNSESETYSNYSNQDLLDLNSEEVHHRPGLNSTTEFSIPSENSSFRSSYEPQTNPDSSKSRSLSPIEEDEKVVICARNKSNDPRDVKQLQEALGNILGFRIQSEGVFCKKTEQQVKDFQEEIGLSPNGIVCNKLWANIMTRNHSSVTNLL